MRGRLILGVVLLLGAAYFAVFGGEYDLFDLRRVRNQQAAEQQRAREERQEVDALRARRDSLATDPATIERLARERHGMVRPGELLYKFEAHDPARDSAAAAAGAPDAAPSSASGSPTAAAGNTPRTD